MAQIERTLPSWQLPLVSDRSRAGSLHTVHPPSSDAWLVGAGIAGAAALAAALAIGGYVAGDAWGTASANLYQLTPE
jgi:hypothetical protein